jgi:predicted dehydrogenase
MTSRLRIVLVGAGSMGSLHARVVSGHERTDLVAVVDPDAGAGNRLAERHGVTAVRDLDDVTAPYDAVVVAAATEHHAAVGTRVLERGVPLLMEKPLADRLEDSERLVAAAAARGVPLMCGLLERYNPAILTAMSLLEEPLHVSAQRHSPYVSRIRTGVASDLLVHDVDLVIRMMGSEPIGVRGSLGHLHPESVSEDVAETLMTFEGNRLGNVSASRLSQRKVRGFVISELARLIEIDMLRATVTLFRHVDYDSAAEDLTYRQQSIIEIPHLITSKEPLVAQLERFVDVVSGRVDADAERDSILPPHRVIETVRDLAVA